MLKGLHTMKNWDYSKNARMVQYMKSISVMLYHHFEGNNRKIISIDAERAFDKIQNTFMMKTLNKLGTEGNYLHIIKASYRSPLLTSESMVNNGNKH